MDIQRGAYLISKNKDLYYFEIILYKIWLLHVDQTWHHLTFMIILIIDSSTWVYVDFSLYCQPLSWNIRIARTDRTLTLLQASCFAHRYEYFLPFYIHAKLYELRVIWYSKQTLGNVSLILTLYPTKQS